MNHTKGAIMKLTEEQIWKCNIDGDRVHICLEHQNVVDFARAVEAAVLKAQPAQQPLTNEQIVQVLGSVRESITGNVFLAFARAVEAAHGITGEKK